jgi:hypothetical protein
MPQQTQYAESRSNRHYAVHQPGLGVEVENVWLEDCGFLRGVDKYQTCNLAGMIPSEASDDQAAIGMSHQDVWSRYAGIGQQRA